MSVRELSEEIANGALSGPLSQPSPSPSPSRILKKKEKTFRASLTRDASMLLLLFMLPVSALLWQGMDTILEGDRRGAMLVGSGLGMLLLGLAYTVYQLGKAVRVTPDRLVFEHHKRQVAMAWGDMKKFHPPVDGQTHFRVMRVGDGEQEIVLDSLCFAEFDLLASLITVARKRKLADKDTSYHL
jgi:hypothetical protein